jgi:hypothetical protein
MDAAERAFIDSGEAQNLKIESDARHNLEDIIKFLFLPFFNFYAPRMRRVNDQ